MISFEISRKQTLNAEKTFLPAAPQLTGKAARKKAIFETAWCEFWADVGDEVSFKQANKGSTKWKVAALIEDFREVKWSKGGKQPLFIKLERTIHGPGNRSKREACWTFPDALKSPQGKDV